MPISLYDGSTRTWVNTNVNQQGPDSIEAQLLLNIFIELQLHTVYLAAMNTGIIVEDPQTIRADIVSIQPTNG